ncbi:MAG TPA: D-alanine--D-alanine ligase family protein [Oscillospiraceae bacterium]|nr:D-alanine--D-alanine ligase family protein [Oscillospiraceae bacterium]
MSKIKLAVIFGGVSSEHEISLISAASVIANIPQDKYEIICIGITKKGRWLFFPGDTSDLVSGSWEQHPDCASAVLSPDRMHKGFIKILDDGQTSFQRVDCIFPVLHGKNGEDGTIQGLIAMSGIPYVGCDTLSSAICMDKTITHTVLEYNGIKTAPWEKVLRRDLCNLDEECERIEASLSYPMFVKPANCGSSIGISKVCDRTELKDGVKLAFSHDSKVIVECEVKGHEIECAVMGNDFPMASIAGEIKPENEFYDYDAKYILSGTQLIIPASISDDCQEKLRSIACDAYKALCCTGLARVDFFVTENEEIVLNEVNTMPGFTSISMFPKLFEATNVPYADLIDGLITLALERN